MASGDDYPNDQVKAESKQSFQNGPPEDDTVFDTSPAAGGKSSSPTEKASNSSVQSTESRKSYLCQCRASDATEGYTKGSDEEKTSAISAEFNITESFKKTPENPEYDDIEVKRPKSATSVEDEKQLRPQSNVSCKSSKSERSTKLEMAASQTKSEGCEEERAPSSVSLKSRASSKSRRSGVSSSPKMEQAEEEENESKIKERSQSAMSQKSNLSAKSKTSRTSEAANKEILDEIPGVGLENFKEQLETVNAGGGEGRAPSVSPSESNSSEQSKPSEVKADENVTQHLEGTSTDMSQISSKCNTEHQQNSDTGHNADNEDSGAEAVDGASLAKSTRSKVSTESNKSSLKGQTDAKHEELLAETEECERVLTPLSVRSNVSSASKKSSKVNAEDVDEPPATTTSPMTLSHEISDERPKSQMSVKSSTSRKSNKSAKSSKSTAPVVTHKDAEETEGGVRGSSSEMQEEQAERVTSSMSANSNISARSTIPNHVHCTCHIDIGAEGSAASEITESSVSCMSDKSAFSVKTARSSVSNVCGGLASTGKYEDENGSSALSVKSAKSNASVRSSRSKKSAISAKSNMSLPKGGVGEHSELKNKAQNDGSNGSEADHTEERAKSQISVHSHGSERSKSVLSVKSTKSRASRKSTKSAVSEVHSAKFTGIPDGVKGSAADENTSEQDQIECTENITPSSQPECEAAEDRSQSALSKISKYSTKSNIVQTTGISVTEVNVSEENSGRARSTRSGKSIKSNKSKLSDASDNTNKRLIDSVIKANIPAFTVEGDIDRAPSAMSGKSKVSARSKKSTKSENIGIKSKRRDSLSVNSFLSLQSLKCKPFDKIIVDSSSTLQEEDTNKDKHVRSHDSETGEPNKEEVKTPSADVAAADHQSKGKNPVISHTESVESDLSQTLSSSDNVNNMNECPMSTDESKKIINVEETSNQGNENNEDVDDCELVPSHLPNASPAEVVNEWLKTVTTEGDTYDMEEPQQDVKTEGSDGNDDNENNLNSSDDLDKGGNDRDVVDSVPNNEPHNMDSTCVLTDDVSKVFHSSVQVMKVLLNPKLDRCHSLPEISPVYGRKLSTSAKGLLDCLVKLQLISYDPTNANEKNERYQELMEILKSLWLCDAPQIGHVFKKNGDGGFVDDEFNHTSSSGVDVTSGSTGSNKSSGWDPCSTADRVRKINSPGKDEKFDEEEIIKCDSTSDETIRNNDSPGEQTAHASGKSSGKDNDGEKVPCDMSSCASPGTQFAEIISQCPDSIWVLTLLTKIENQFMKHYNNAMLEFKVRRNMDDNEQLETMIRELQIKVQNKIQTSIDRELRRIQSHVGFPRPPREALSRASTTQSERRRQKVKMLPQQSGDSRAEKNEDSATGSCCSDERSESEEHCQCETCTNTKTNTKPFLLEDSTGMESESVPGVKNDVGAQGYSEYICMTSSIDSFVDKVIDEAVRKVKGKEEHNDSEVGLVSTADLCHHHHEENLIENNEAEVLHDVKEPTEIVEAFTEDTEDANQCETAGETEVGASTVNDGDDTEESGAATSTVPQLEEAVEPEETQELETENGETDISTTAADDSGKPKNVNVPDDEDYQEEAPEVTKVENDDEINVALLTSNKEECVEDQVVDEQDKPSDAQAKVTTDEDNETSEKSSKEPHKQVSLIDEMLEEDVDVPGENQVHEEVNGDEATETTVAALTEQALNEEEEIAANSEGGELEEEVIKSACKGEDAASMGEQESDKCAEECELNVDEKSEFEETAEESAGTEPHHDSAEKKEMSREEAVASNVVEASIISDFAADDNPTAKSEVDINNDECEREEVESAEVDVSPTNEDESTEVNETKGDEQSEKPKADECVDSGEDELEEEAAEVTSAEDENARGSEVAVTSRPESEEHEEEDEMLSSNKSTENNEDASVAESLKEPNGEVETEDEFDLNVDNSKINSSLASKAEIECDEGESRIENAATKGSFGEEIVNDEVEDTQEITDEGDGDKENEDEECVEVKNVEEPEESVSGGECDEDETTEAEKSEIVIVNTNDKDDMAAEDAEEESSEHEPEQDAAEEEEIPAVCGDDQQSDDEATLNDIVEDAIEHESEHQPEEEESVSDEDGVHEEKETVSENDLQEAAETVAADDEDTEENCVADTSEQTSEGGKNVKEEKQSDEEHPASNRDDDCADEEAETVKEIPGEEGISGEEDADLPEKDSCVASTADEGESELVNDEVEISAKSDQDQTAAEDEEIIEVNNDEEENVTKEGEADEDDVVEAEISDDGNGTGGTNEAENDESAKEEAGAAETSESDNNLAEGEENPAEQTPENDVECDISEDNTEEGAEEENEGTSDHKSDTDGLMTAEVVGDDEAAPDTNDEDETTEDMEERKDESDDAETLAEESDINAAVEEEGPAADEDEHHSDDDITAEKEVDIFEKSAKSAAYEEERAASVKEEEIPAEETPKKDVEGDISEDNNEEGAEEENALDHEGNSDHESDTHGLIEDERGEGNEEAADKNDEEETPADMVTTKESASEEDVHAEGEADVAETSAQESDGNPDLEEEAPAADEDKHQSDDEEALEKDPEEDQEEATESSEDKEEKAADVEESDDESDTGGEMEGVIDENEEEGVDTNNENETTEAENACEDDVSAREEENNSETPAQESDMQDDEVEEAADTHDEDAEDLVETKDGSASEEDRSPAEKADVAETESGSDAAVKENVCDTDEGEHQSDDEEALEEESRENISEDIKEETAELTGDEGETVVDVEDTSDHEQELQKTEAVGEGPADSEDDSPDEKLEEECERATEAENGGDGEEMADINDDDKPADDDEGSEGEGDADEDNSLAVAEEEARAAEDSEHESDNIVEEETPAASEDNHESQDESEREEDADDDERKEQESDINTAVEEEIPVNDEDHLSQDEEAPEQDREEEEVAKPSAAEEEKAADVEETSDPESDKHEQKKTEDVEETAANCEDDSTEDDENPPEITTSLEKVPREEEEVEDQHDTEEVDPESRVKERLEVTDDNEKGEEKDSQREEETLEVTPDDEAADKSEAENENPDEDEKTLVEKETLNDAEHVDEATAGPLQETEQSENDSENSCDDEDLVKETENPTANGLSGEETPEPTTEIREDCTEALKSGSETEEAEIAKESDEAVESGNGPSDVDGEEEYVGEAIEEEGGTEHVGTKNDQHPTGGDELNSDQESENHSDKVEQTFDEGDATPDGKESDGCDDVVKLRPGVNVEELSDNLSLKAGDEDDVTQSVTNLPVSNSNNNNNNNNIFNEDSGDGEDEAEEESDDSGDDSDEEQLCAPKDRDSVQRTGEKTRLIPAETLQKLKAESEDGAYADGEDSETETNQTQVISLRPKNPKS